MPRDSSSSFKGGISAVLLANHCIFSNFPFYLFDTHQVLVVGCSLGLSLGRFFTHRPVASQHLAHARGPVRRQLQQSGGGGIM